MVHRNHRNVCRNVTSVFICSCIVLYCIYLLLHISSYTFITVSTTLGCHCWIVSIYKSYLSIVVSLLPDLSCLLLNHNQSRLSNWISSIGKVQGELCIVCNLLFTITFISYLVRFNKSNMSLVNIIDIKTRRQQMQITDLRRKLWQAPSRFLILVETNRKILYEHFDYEHSFLNLWT